MSISFNKLKTNTGMDDVITFGTRYRGYTVEEVLKTDPSYISWLIQNTNYKFYPSVHEELSRKITKHVPRGAGIYYGDLRGEMAHEIMTQIQSTWDDSGWDDDAPF